MERRLIDANEFIEDLKTEAVNLYLDGMKGTPRDYKELYGIIDRIDEQPTIDAVEVVRCRECKRFREYSEEYKATVKNADGDCAIRKWYSDDEQLYAVTKDDYCSLGERREPDGE